MSKYKSEYADMVRVWGYIPKELHESILEIAERKQRKESQVISLLLQQAVKERQRKRKNVQKVHI
jgi:hypothetical protein